MAPAYYPVTVCRSDGQFEVTLKNGASKELNRPTAEQLDKTPDAEGYVDFYEPLGLEDTKAKDWRRKIGGMLMHVLGGKEHAGRSYILKEFPEGYVLYEHKKYNQNKVSEDKGKEKGKHAAGVFERQDAYMYGHPQGRKKRYRSPADFFPHVLWLATDEEGDPRNCSCKLCSPDGEQEFEEPPVNPDATMKKEIKPAPEFITPAENKQPAPLPARAGFKTPDAATQASRPKPNSLVAASSHRSAEQELDSMANGIYTYRPGELVWFTKGAAWGLGVISKRQAVNNKPRYLLQPLSHPLRYPPYQIKEGDNVMRPWLAWTVPSTTHPQIRTMAYDEVPWERVLAGEFGPGDAEVDGSILAAQAINSSYSLFDRIDNPLAVPGEAHYRGMFLGGEKIWVGEPVRLRGIGDEIIILIIHKLIERTTQSPPTSMVTVVGDIHKLVSMPNPYKDRSEWPVPALPDRMVADLRFRNEVADVAGRRDWLEWRLLEPAARRGLSDIRGRWYESRSLLPIIKPPDFVKQEIARGEMSDTGNLLNTRGDGFAAVLKRKKNRKDTFGRAVPDDLKVSRGLDGPESDGLFPDEVQTNQDLFSYTSGRFLYNENTRLREQYVEFDANALLREAEKHIGPSHGHAACIIKLAEGGFNRVFLLTMDDGFEAIVKIPYRITGPKHYATASEAATLHYLHSKGIPVPRVYGYSSSESNPHEQASVNDINLPSGFVEIEKKFLDIPFGSIGSMYFKGDVPSGLQAALYATTSAEKDNDTEISCPVKFTDAELDGFQEQKQLRFELNSVVNHWRDEIGGISEDGWMSDERYDDVVRKVAELKASLLATAEGDEEDIRLLEKGWLFRDREEIN
ncbi:hypothetical protein B7463_g6170, partial [Scytalidium lignicola]